MRFSKSDLLVVGIGAAVITSFALLFYFDITRRAAGSGEEVVGKITFRKKIAQRKYSSQVVWDNLEQNSPVYNFDTLRTAEQSEASINLNDGTKISLNENSMILLELTKNELNIKFTQGSISAKRDDIKGKDVKQVTIQSENTKISIDKSDINMNKTKGKELNLTVLKGDAKISSGDKEQVVKENQQVVATADEVKIYPLSLILIDPQQQAHFMTRGARKNIPFSWKPVDKKNNLFLEIAGDASFNKIQQSIRVNADRAALDLADGIYYWRLKGVHFQTKKLEFSEARRINITRDDPVALMSPPNNASVTYNTERPMIQFKWSRSPDSAEYRLKVSPDQAMSKSSFSSTLADTAIAVDTLENGTYFWKVDKVTKVNGETFTTPSATYRLVVQKTKNVEPPQPIYPADNLNLSVDDLKKNNMTFTWNTDPEITKSKLLISRSSTFSDVVFTSMSTSNFTRLTKGIEPGTYYWRIAGTLSDGKETQPSISRTFTIIKKEAIVLKGPVNNERIASDIKGTVQFSWNMNEAKGKYLLEVSRTNTFTEIYKTAATEQNSAQINDFNPGNYFWRVKLIGKKGETITSPINVFSLSRPLGYPVALMPKEGQTIDMTDRNTLDIQWMRLEGANQYKIELFQVKDGAFFSTMRLTTGATNYSLADLKKLDVGKFCLTIQALETKGANTIIRKSPESRVYFNITLKQKIEKVKLKTPKVLLIE